MFPVLYEGKTDEDIPRFKSGNKEYEIDFDYLHIYDWWELIEILKKVHNKIISYGTILAHSFCYTYTTY